MRGMSWSTSSSLSGPLFIITDMSLSRSASLDQRSTTISMLPAAPRFMFTALARYRAPVPLVCACAASDNSAAAATPAVTAEIRRYSPGITTSWKMCFKEYAVSAGRAGLLAGRRREHRFATFAAAQVDHLGGLSDLQHVERVGLVVNFRDRLPGNLDDDVAFLHPGLLAGAAADHAA